ncbi:uncharacterized protein LOC119736373 [Patiria miniata]|uniref:Beta-1,4-galactosyltransferase n=1 Tax=Patiria miniata TaxID=46514 RepID=A0A914ARP5_PATMI|nr:uncharacterized protein LOC119736373 [Patiria miniata]
MLSTQLPTNKRHRSTLPTTTRKMSVFRRGSLPAMLFTLIGFSSVSLVFFGSFLNQHATVKRQIVLGEPSSFIRRAAPGKVCPELNIPNLIRNNTLDLSDIKMNQSEEHIFKGQQDQVDRFVMEGNGKLQTILKKSRSYNASVWEHITESLSPIAIEVGNYSYIPGGFWKPTTCLPRWKVAIIIPYRNRSYHLPILLRYLTPMLQRQLLEFAFFVVHQDNRLEFNRAMLMNVGFAESLNFSKWDCFIFHDVDHIPISDFNYYGCSGMPRHFVSGVDKWKYKLPYASFFGAVSGLTTDNMRSINGFPNVYWGWGGEDDELWERCKAAQLPVSRPVGFPGYYHAIQHHHLRAKPAKERFNLLRSFKPRSGRDGLSNLQYKRPVLELHELYTNISVDIQKLHIDPRFLRQTAVRTKPGTVKKVYKPANKSSKVQKTKAKLAKAAESESRNQTRVETPLKRKRTSELAMEVHEDLDVDLEVD